MCATQNGNVTFFFSIVKNIFEFVGQIVFQFLSHQFFVCFLNKYWANFIPKTTVWKLTWLQVEKYFRLILYLFSRQLCAEKFTSRPLAIQLDIWHYTNHLSIFCELWSIPEERFTFWPGSAVILFYAAICIKISVIKNWKLYWICSRWIWPCLELNIREGLRLISQIFHKTTRINGNYF